MLLCTLQKSQDKTGKIIHLSQTSVKWENFSRVQANSVDAFRPWRLAPLRGCRAKVAAPVAKPACAGRTTARSCPTAVGFSRRFDRLAVNSGRLRRRWLQLPFSTQIERIFPFPSAQSAEEFAHSGRWGRRRHRLRLPETSLSPVPAAASKHPPCYHSVFPLSPSSRLGLKVIFQGVVDVILPQGDDILLVVIVRREGLQEQLAVVTTHNRTVLLGVGGHHPPEER